MSSHVNQKELAAALLTAPEAESTPCTSVFLVVLLLYYGWVPGCPPKESLSHHRMSSALPYAGEMPADPPPLYPAGPIGSR